MNISNFNNIQDYFPIVSGAILTDLIVIFLLNIGVLKSKTLQGYYLDYGFSAVIADVLIIVIGVIIARFLYFYIFQTYSLLKFVLFAIGIQLVHDILFYYFFRSFPKGASRIMDTFQNYANENGYMILLADALMMVSTILFATAFSSLNLNSNIIIFIVSMYLVPYILHSVKVINR
jgi:hypothetical protein